MIGMHLEDATDTLTLTLGGVVDVAAAAEHAAVDAEEGQLADEWVGHDLEGERGEGIVVVDVPHRQDAVTGHRPLDGGLVQR